MSVGLPGSGIGGVFYLLSALWMPFDSVLRRCGSARARSAITQSLLALSIIAALYLTAVGLEHVMTAFVQPGAPAMGMARTHTAPHLLKEATFAATFGTLALVLLSVQVLRLMVAGSGTADVAEGRKQRRAA